MVLLLPKCYYYRVDMLSTERQCHIRLTHHFGLIQYKYINELNTLVIYLSFVYTMVNMINSFIVTIYSYFKKSAIILMIKDINYNILLN